jgi:hypothetical protein
MSNNAQRFIEEVRAGIRAMVGNIIDGIQHLRKVGPELIDRVIDDDGFGLVRWWTAHVTPKQMVLFVEQADGELMWTEFTPLEAA